MQLCSVAKFFRPYGTSQFIWGLIWIWYDLNASFLCVRTRLEKLYGLTKKKSIVEKSSCLYKLKLFSHYIIIFWYFFCEPYFKSDKNSNITVKKLELIASLPKKIKIL